MSNSVRIGKEVLKDHQSLSGAMIVPFKPSVARDFQTSRFF